MNFQHLGSCLIFPTRLLLITGFLFFFCPSLCLCCASLLSPCLLWEWSHTTSRQGLPDLDHRCAWISAYFHPPDPPSHILSAGSELGLLHTCCCLPASGYPQRSSHTQSVQCPLPPLGPPGFSTAESLSLPQPPCDGSLYLETGKWCQLSIIHYK